MTTRKKMHKLCNIFHLVKAWQRHLVDMYVKAKLRVTDHTQMVGGA